MKVVFAGTPVFAAVALQALLDAGYEVPLVLTQPDRPAGRGMKLQASPVKQLAQQHGIAVSQPRSLRLDGRYPDDAAEAQAVLQAVGADVMVVAAYGLLLPTWTLTLPRLGCLNIHASLLPRWRGAAPIHRAIEAGDAQTGITIMQMDEGLDTGDMLLVEALPIQPGDTTATLHDRLADLGGRLVVAALQQAAQGALAPVPQPAVGVTYAHKIEKAEALIDWRLPAEVLARRVQAFDPFPGAATLWGDVPLKVWAARCDSSGSAGSTDMAGEAAPGTVLAVEGTGICVQTGQGVLCLTELQRPGGKRLPVAEFLHGAAVPVGARLGSQASACS